MEFTFTFIQLLSLGVYLVSPILLILCFLVVVFGITVGRIESWSKFDSIYWAFITALTVGYGDMRPVSKSSKIISVLIAWLGIMLTGLMVAVTVQTATKSFEIHIKPSIVQKHQID